MTSFFYWISGSILDLDNYEIDLQEEYAPDSLYFSMYLNTAQFDKVVEMINSNQKITNYIDGKKIIKKIFVPNKIVNLIVK